MGITTIASMQIVPEKFTQYVTEATTEKSTLVKAGIATPDPVVAQLIGGTPEGGRFITIPAWNPLNTGVEEDVFGEQDVTVDGITTKDSRATLLMRQKAWGGTDLAHVLGGADPMAAIIRLISDYRTAREQQVYLSILKAILDTTKGAIKEHVNDISGETGAAAAISPGATLDTKQALGDTAGSLGLVFLHSATYTYLQKSGLITRTPLFDPTQGPVEFENYMGYTIQVDDGMPVNGDIYDTFFLGSNAFIRQEGTPAGFVGTETDRDKLGAKNYIINRWCQIIHPRGFSWVPDEATELTNPLHRYPANADLMKPENWRLATHHKNVPIACLRHKLG